MLQLQNVPLVLISLATILTSSVKTSYYTESSGIDNHKSHHYDHDTSFVLAYDSIRKESGYYRNSNLKFIAWSIYDRQKSIETKRIIERFRKSGKRRYVRQYLVHPDRGALVIYEARYDPDGRLAVVSQFSYDSDGILIEYPPEECDQQAGN